MLSILFSLIVLLISVIIHEVSHGIVAERLGDPTAREEGRITLNPLSHLDLFGSFLLPLTLAFIGAPVIGWAKPVPYNPMRLKRPVRDAALIGIAGPVSNFVLACGAGWISRIALATGDQTLASLLQGVAIINIALGVFNLFPIPPLDGSKLLFALLPQNEQGWKVIRFLEQYGTIFLIFFVIWGGSILGTAINWVAHLIL